MDVNNNSLREVKIISEGWQTNILNRRASRFWRAFFSRVMIAVAIAFVFAASARDASALSQWRKRTPRDTLYVPARQETPWISGHVIVDQFVETKLYISGTFGVFPGQDSTGFDARYTYQVPGWNAPYPLENPPSWGGTNYQVYLEATANEDQSDYDSIHVLETAYQPNHQYTALYSGNGSPFEFRIYDQFITQPNAYLQSTGGINIRTAQYTAGISIQTSTLNFPLTNLGTTSTLIDSIASYGEDTLVIDSFWIGGPTASDFKIVSQNGNYFTLPNESANKFSVSYSPTTPNPSGEDTLYIHSPNADGTDRLSKIFLFGSGGKPDGEISPSSIDFGLQRVGTNSVNQYVIVANSGNVPLIIDSVPILPPALNGVFTCNAKFPIPIGPSGYRPISFVFTPAAKQTYQATAEFYTSDGKITPVVLNGQGAMPIFDVLDTSLNFGTVFTYNKAVLYDTVRNTGDWTEHVTRVSIYGPGSPYFSFQPSADTGGFFLNAGGSVIYAITFQPSTTTDAGLSADIVFFFEDATNPKEIHLFGNEKRPRISYDTNFVDFGLVKIGNTETKIVGVTNASKISQPFSKQINPSGEFYVKAPSPNTFGFPNDSLSLAFAPNFRGPASAWAYIQCNEQQDSIYMIGYGAVAKPVFIPKIDSFLSCSVNTQNYSSTTVSDTGDYPLIICGLQIVGPDSSEFSFEPVPKLPDTIKGGGADSRTYGFNFTFNSYTGKTHYATLDILYCDGSIDTIPLRGTEAKGSVTLLTNRIDFGTVRVGKTLSRSAVFRNLAPIPLAVDTIWTNPSTEPFSVNQNTLTIPAKSNDSVSVTFAPTARGYSSAWFNANGIVFEERSIDLTGTGAEPIPILSSNKIDFGKIDIGKTSNTFGLTLTDSGNWPISVRIEKQNDIYNEFTVVMESGSTIDPVGYDSVAIDSSHYYKLTFTPRYPEAPDHEAQLVFHYDDSTTQTVELVGQDISDYLAFDADTIDFGLVRVGTTPSPDTTVNIVNTTGSVQTATNIQPPAAPFSIAPGAPITVDSDSTVPIKVTFAPQAIGFTQSTIVGQGAPFESPNRNLVVIEGSGAAPEAILSTNILDFGTVAVGNSVVRSFTLANRGNWPLTVHCSGTNSPDFTPTPAIPSDTTISAGDSVSYTVQFLATTPIPLPTRTAQITWTQDDSSTFSLDLIEHDVPALPVQIGFPQQYFGRPGDKFVVSLDLQAAIPDTLGIRHIRGTVNWNPSVVNIPSGGAATAGNLVPTPGWSFNTSSVQNGSFSYDISSSTDQLSKAGTLLNFTLQFNSDLSDGASSPLIALDTLPDTYEAIATEGQSSAFLDSNCGTIHLLTGGNPIANFIGQNIPNPFGADAPQTMLPFDVDADNTPITIRILDATGREVLRPIDHQPFAQGRYNLPINATDLRPGIYFYEFRANGEPPQVKKMAVEK